MTGAGTDNSPGRARHVAVVVRSAALIVAAGTTAASSVPARHLVWCIPIAFMVLWRWADGTRARPACLSTGLDAGADLVLTSLAVVATGGLSSGFSFYAVVSVGLLALERGWPASGLGTGLCYALVLTGGLANGRPPTPSTGMVWALDLGLGLLTGSYARRLVADADDHRRRTLVDTARLARTNIHLADLCRAAGEGSLPADDLACARRAAEHLHELLGPDVVAVLGLRDQDQDWVEVLLAEGVHLAATMSRSDLPAAVRAACAERRAVSEQLGPLSAAGSGLAPESRSALYLPMLVGDRTIGLLAIESAVPRCWDAADLTLAEAVAARAALTIDNAHRFAMLCVTGLSEERRRLAGELHDRTGQSVAAIGLQLDIILRQVSDEEVRDSLRSLRLGVRAVVAELRNTMHALRCEVSEDMDLTRALHRLPEHYPLKPQVTVTTGEAERLPLIRERQVYMLAREAVAAAASAGADNISVCWYRDEGVPSLMVVDDAPIGTAPSKLHAGFGGVPTMTVETMRARCESLEGQFHLTRTTRGTVLRCSL